MQAPVLPGLVTAGASVKNATLAGKVTSAWRAQQMLQYSPAPTFGPVECLPPTFTLHHTAETELSRFCVNDQEERRTCLEHLVKENNYITPGGVPFPDCQSLTEENKL